MFIRLGYEIGIACSVDTVMISSLEIHPERRRDIVREQAVALDPAVGARVYSDGHGNLCRRFTAPSGEIRLSYDAVVRDSGQPELVNPLIGEVPLDELPDACIVYLLGSRYCETELLMKIAWDLFGKTPPGWQRVQAICDFVHERMSFGYSYARATRTAGQAYDERVGVGRDFAHLAVAFCRCMNIPARYVNGFLGDIGLEADRGAPPDFSAWFEAYLEGGWYTFDARHNVPRIGRVAISRGRDATDVPLIHSFGPHRLTHFEVWTREEPEAAVLERRVAKERSLLVI